MSKFSIILVLFGVISVTYGFMGFTINGTSLLHREPPVPIRKSSYAVQTLWIDQKLDHFDTANKVTWKMRYMANDQHFKANGPIFIFVGGEWEISEGYLQGGHMYDMAQQLNGYMFYTEHRYYGKSIPTADASTYNLQYLTVEQALADIAHLIENRKASIPGLKNSQAILIGGSYSGTMVAWFRQAYPNLAAGTWASSAPVFAKADFFEYKRTVGESIRLLGGNACYNHIEKGFAEIIRLYDIKDFKTIEKKLNFCYPINIKSKSDEWYMFDTLANSFSGLIQYHWGTQMKDVCDIILSNPVPIDGLAKYLTSSGDCMYTDWDNLVEYYKGETWGTGPTDGGRQWMYQTCRQFGWFQSSGTKDQPFGDRFPHQLYLGACRQIFGDQYLPEDVYNNIEYTNYIHHGFDPKVNNVYFTHGQLDPWRPMGIQKDYNENSPADVIPLASHVADTGSISSSDSPQMRAVKEKIFKLSKKWLHL